MRETLYETVSYHNFWSEKSGTNGKSEKYVLVIHAYIDGLRFGAIVRFIGP